MIEACVKEQIERGLISEESFEMQVKVRMRGGFGMKALSKKECERWYKSVFGGNE